MYNETDIERGYCCVAGSWREFALTFNRDRSPGISCLSTSESKSRRFDVRDSRSETASARARARAITLVSVRAEGVLQTICLELPYVRDNRPRRTEMALTGMPASIIFFAAHVLQKFAASAARRAAETMRAVNRAHRLTVEMLKLPLRGQNARGGTASLGFGKFRR